MFSLSGPIWIWWKKKRALLSLPTSISCGVSRCAQGQRGYGLGRASLWVLNTQIKKPDINKTSRECVAVVWSWVVEEGTVCVSESWVARLLYPGCWRQYHTNLVVLVTSQISVRLLKLELLAWRGEVAQCSRLCVILPEDPIRISIPMSGGLFGFPGHTNT